MAQWFSHSMRRRWWWWVLRVVVHCLSCGGCLHRARHILRLWKRVVVVVVVMMMVVVVMMEEEVVVLMMMTVEEVVVVEGYVTGVEQRCLDFYLYAITQMLLAHISCCHFHSQTLFARWGYEYLVVSAPPRKCGQRGSIFERG